MSDIRRLDVTTGMFLSWTPGTSDIQLHVGATAAISLRELPMPEVRQAFYNWAWNYINVNVATLPLSYLDIKERENAACYEEPPEPRDGY